MTADPAFARAPKCACPDRWVGNPMEIVRWVMRARRREGSQPLPSPYFWPRAHLREPELAAVQSEVAAPTARALTFLSRFSDPGSAPLSEHDRRPHRFRCPTDFRMRADR